MPVRIDQVLHGRPGDALFFGSISRDGAASVVFEDDGTTAYFYACQPIDGRAGPVLDALHIYDVAQVTDGDRPSVYKIGWAPERRCAVLLVNGEPHAVFDFERTKGWCRTGFPPAQPQESGWSPDGHAWDDASLAPFR